MGRKKKKQKKTLQHFNYPISIWQWTNYGERETRSHPRTARSNQLLVICIPIFINQTKTLKKFTQRATMAQFSLVSATLISAHIRPRLRIRQINCESNFKITFGNSNRLPFDSIDIDRWNRFLLFFRYSVSSDLHCYIRRQHHWGFFFVTEFHAIVYNAWWTSRRTNVTWEEASGQPNTQKESFA